MEQVAHVTRAMYLVEGEDWFYHLQKYGYHWGNTHGDLVGSGAIGERDINNGSSYCIVVDTKEKSVSWFPLEIYAPESPIANKEKFDYYVAKCLSDSDLIKNIKAIEAKE